MEEQKRRVYISTGKKGVMYTLWTEIIQPPTKITDKDGKEFMAYGWVHNRYIQNLSMSEDKAIEKAKEYSDAHKMTFVGIFDSPYNERADWIDRWGIHFQSKKKNGKKFFFGKATPEFWDAWKVGKEQIKKEGFSVSKFEYKDERENKQIQWYVFYRQEE